MISRLKGLLANVPMYLHTFGWKGLLSFARIRYSSSASPMPLYLRGYKDPVWLRPKSTDVMTMREIFLARDYDLGTKGKAQVIVDAGANIGLSAVFFAQAYPHAKIIAIEPEKENFLLLTRNTRAYPGVIPMHAALWAGAGRVSLIDPGRGEHGFTTQEMGSLELGGESVPAVSVDTLLRMHGLDGIDLLKVDIEGAEKEVFESAEPWIDRVGTVIVELHDRFKPGCHEAFSHATRRMRDESNKGKLIMKTQDVSRIG